MLVDFIAYRSGFHNNTTKKSIILFYCREKSVRTHLTAVYSSLAIGLSAAAVGACAHFLTDFFRAGFLASIGKFVCKSVALRFPKVASGSQSKQQLSQTKKRLSLPSNS